MTTSQNQNSLADFLLNMENTRESLQLCVICHWGLTVDLLASWVMIDLHGRVTDKDYEAISNGSCNLRPKHCFIMMCAAIYTADTDGDFKDTRHQIIYQSRVLVRPSQQRPKYYFQPGQDFLKTQPICLSVHKIRKENFFSNAEQLKFVWSWLRGWNTVDRNSSMTLKVKSNC